MLSATNTVTVNFWEAVWSTIQLRPLSAFVFANPQYAEVGLLGQSISGEPTLYPECFSLALGKAPWDEVSREPKFHETQWVLSGICRESSWFLPFDSRQIHFKTHCLSFTLPKSIT